MTWLQRRAALAVMASGAAWCGFGAVAMAQENYQPPRLGRYRVEGIPGWIRDLVIENEKDYAVYEARNGPLYGRGTFSFDGRSVRFLTGPFYTMGYRGSSFVGPDGKHRLRLGTTVDATSID